MNGELAAHFCRLLINDGQSIMPLSVHARRVIEPYDSMTSEQIFVEFVMRDDNWQSLRLFPHCEDDGGLVWYAPSDELPASLGAEHQKYIHEVFPRLMKEVEAENWTTVDAYIDRMIQYQCQFGGSQLPPAAPSGVIIGIFILFFTLIIVGRTKFFSYFCKLKRKRNGR